MLRDDRFHGALGRQLFFTGTILLIEVPLGVAIAPTVPKEGPWVSVCLRLLAAAGSLTLIPGAIVIYFVRNYIARGFALGRV